MPKVVRWVLHPIVRRLSHGISQVAVAASRSLSLWAAQGWTGALNAKRSGVGKRHK